MEEQKDENYEVQPRTKAPFSIGLAIGAGAVVLAALAASIIIIMSFGGKGGNSNNGDSNPPIPPSHTCSFGDWVETKAPTCSEYGEREKTCSCGNKQTEQVYKKDHTYGEWITEKAPTCDKAGNAVRTCTLCAHEDVKTLPKTYLHTEVIDSSKAPTCTSTGLTEGRHCSVCNTVIVMQTSVPKLPHTYDDKYDETCNKCSFIRDAACPHTNTVVLTGKTATCTESGLTEGERCVKCEEILVAQRVISATGHVDGDWIIDSNATCTEAGSKHIVCSKCSATLRSEAISATGHADGDWIIDSNATCTEAGSKHIVCSKCSETLRVQTIDAIGHVSNDKIVESKSCVQKNGKVSYKCDNCSENIEESIRDISISYEQLEYGTMWTNSGVYNYAEFKATAIGGYDDLLYRFEVYSSTSDTTVDYEQDYSTNNTVGFQSTGSLNNCVLKILVKDNYGNESWVKIMVSSAIKLDGAVIEASCAELTCENDTTYINTYGFGKYICGACQRITYKDKTGDELELAELTLTRDGTTVLSCSNVDTAELLVIPDSVTSFDDSYIFGGADNLKYVKFNDNKFYFALWYTPIKQIYLPQNADVSMSGCDGLELVIMENGITDIPGFSESGLKEIVIPVSITYIGSSRFQGCTNLTSVFYMGTAEEWDNITISTGNAYLTEADRYYYSESEPIAEGNYWHYVDGVPTVWN